METKIYKPQQFNLSGLIGISDKTLEMHFKLYEGYVKATNDLSARIQAILADGKVDQEEMPAYSELTDPDEQRARFLDQQRLRRSGDQEAHPLDEEFLEALEHGMPPAGGIGLGVDRLLKILLDAANLREVILFPHLRPEGGRD